MPGASRFLAVCAAASFALLAACGGGGGGDGGQPPPPDLSGTWSGAWQGNDPQLGTVSGTWEVTITQGANSATGPGTLLGDVDCMDAQVHTNPNAQTAVTGSVTRAPCGTVNWTLTALNVGTGSAAGTWTNATTGGSGTMGGTRIATLTGPRTFFVSPPGGKPGAIATVVGQNLSGLASPLGLLFGGTAQPTVQSADATRIIARVPAGASTGAVETRTAVGTALSPLLFNTGVTVPPLVLGNSLTQESGPAAVAVSPDGRKFYIAYRGNLRLSVVRASTLANVVTRTLTGASRSIVPSPDGKRIYVAAAGIGVLNMEAATAAEINRVSFAINDEGRDNPQGIAISADGRLLAVSEGTAGGSVRVFSISGDSLTQIAIYSPGAGIAPLGVAFSPDGARVYVAAADALGGNGTLRVIDPATGAQVDSEVVGVLPTGIAVSPSGDLVFVSNKNSNTVSVYSSAIQALADTVNVGVQPTGIAYTPDGTQVYVVNQGDDNLSVLSATADSSVLSTFALGADAPLAIAINASGTTAYVTRMTGNSVVELGGMRTLTILRDGSGIGAVSSSPAGINCGTSCQAQFPVGSSITLAATPDSTSSFVGFSGLGCGSFVTLNDNKICRATFNSNTPPPSQQQQNQEDCFIATAAYGSEMASEVRLLREFRGRWLMTNEPGRAFVRFYYRNSPALAEKIRGNDGARAAVRVALWPVVWTIAHPASALCFVLSCGLLGFALRRRLSARAG